jgi:hypothetical protein
LCPRNSSPELIESPAAVIEAIHGPVTNDEHIAAVVRRLYCKTCKGVSGEKRRQLKVEQTREPPDGPLLPGPDEVEWKRFVRGQRR